MIATVLLRRPNIEPVYPSFPTERDFIPSSSSVDLMTLYSTPRIHGGPYNAYERAIDDCRLTRPCSRPLRARDRSLFDSSCDALTADTLVKHLFLPVRHLLGIQKSRCRTCGSNRYTNKSVDPSHVCLLSLMQRCVYYPRTSRRTWSLSFKSLLEMIRFIVGCTCLPQLPRDGKPPIPETPIPVTVRPTLRSGLLPVCLCPHRMLE